MNDALLMMAGSLYVVLFALLGGLARRPVDAATCVLLGCTAGMVLAVAVVPSGEWRSLAIAVLMLAAGWALGWSAAR